MLRVTKLVVPVASTFVCVALLAPPAVANVQVKTVNDVASRTWNPVSARSISGSIWMGPTRASTTTTTTASFTVTYTAHGTTLTQKSEAFSEVITYNRDGSAKTYTARGPVAKFTVPGQGIVLLNAGTATWSEPEENLLFLTGPHQTATGDFEAFCAVFG